MFSDVALQKFNEFLVTARAVPGPRGAIDSAQALKRAARSAVRKVAKDAMESDLTLQEALEELQQLVVQHHGSDAGAHQAFTDAIAQLLHSAGGVKEYANPGEDEEDDEENGEPANFTGDTPEAFAGMPKPGGAMVPDKRAVRAAADNIMNIQDPDLQRLAFDRLGPGGRSAVEAELDRRRVAAGGPSFSEMFGEDALRRVYARR